MTNTTELELLRRIVLKVIADQPFDPVTVGELLSAGITVRLADSVALDAEETALVGGLLDRELDAGQMEERTVGDEDLSELLRCPHSGTRPDPATYPLYSGDPPGTGYYYFDGGYHHCACSNVVEWLGGKDLEAVIEEHNDLRIQVALEVASQRGYRVLIQAIENPGAHSDKTPA